MDMDSVSAKLVKEQHLLSRVIFSMGAVIFVACVIARDATGALIGAGIVFTSLLIHYLVVIFRIGYDPPAKATKPAWETLYVLNPLVVFVLAVACFLFAARLHFYNSSAHSCGSSHRLRVPF
jgi:hypothetical protein